MNTKIITVEVIIDADVASNLTVASDVDSALAQISGINDWTIRNQQGQTFDWLAGRPESGSGNWSE